MFQIRVGNAERKRSGWRSAQVDMYKNNHPYIVTHGGIISDGWRERAFSS